MQSGVSCQSGKLPKFCLSVEPWAISWKTCHFYIISGAPRSWTLSSQSPYTLSDRAQLFSNSCWSQFFCSGQSRGIEAARSWELEILKSTQRAAEPVAVPGAVPAQGPEPCGGTGGAVRALAGAVMLMPLQIASTVPLAAEENKLKDLSGSSLLEISSSADTSSWHIPTRNEVTASAWAPLGSDPTRRTWSHLSWALRHTFVSFHCWWHTSPTALHAPCMAVLKCHGGMALPDSCRFFVSHFAFSQIPYLALVAASSAAPAAVGAFVLAFSSENKQKNRTCSCSSKCNNFVSLQNSLQTPYQLTQTIYTYAHNVVGSVSILSLNTSVSSSDLHAKFTPSPELLWAY